MTVFINQEKNEVFRTSDFVLVLCFVVLIIELTSFCNFCFIILVEVIVVKSANGFFMFGVVMNLHFIFHIVSALYQPSINFSHRAFIPLAYIGVSSLHMMKYEKRVCIILYENANAYYANGNTKDTIHFSFLKNMI